MLKPERTVQRFMISTTSRLVGEYNAEDFIIDHIFQPGSDRMYENAYSRSYFMVSIYYLDPRELAQGGFIIYPKLSIDPLIICLSVLYGKRFDFNGSVQSFGIHQLPILSSSDPTKHPKIGFNNHSPRSNYSIPLNLEHLSIMKPIFDDENPADQKVIDFFLAAGRFYVQSLQRYGNQAESAYLDLITCGEILSNFYQYSEDELYDADFLGRLKEIEQLGKREATTVKIIKNRNYQVLRKFVKTIMSLLNEDFCLNHESNPHSVMNWETIESRIKSAYELRSSYVHTGKRFEQQIQREDEERQWGTWSNSQNEEMNKEEKAFYKALNNAPTFKGLERIIRYCLLRFLENNGAICMPELPRQVEEMTAENIIQAKLKGEKHRRRIRNW